MTKVASSTKRVVFRVPATDHADITEFAKERGDTVVGLFRWCLSVGRVIATELMAGNRIIVISKEDGAKKELIFSK